MKLMLVVLTFAPFLLALAGGVYFLADDALARGPLAMTVAWTLCRTASTGAAAPVGAAGLRRPCVATVAP